MEYETLISEYVEYGKNKFIEISKKKVSSENTVFINISKGYYTPSGVRRYQRGIGFPPESEIVQGLITKLQSVMDSVSEDEIPKAQPEHVAEIPPEEDNQESQMSDFTDDIDD